MTTYLVIAALLGSVALVARLWVRAEKVVSEQKAEIAVLKQVIINVQENKRLTSGLSDDDRRVLREKYKFEG